MKKEKVMKKETKENIINLVFQFQPPKHLKYLPTVEGIVASRDLKKLQVTEFLGKCGAEIIENNEFYVLIENKNDILNKIHDKFNGNLSDNVIIINF